MKRLSLLLTIFFAVSCSSILSSGQYSFERNPANSSVAAARKIGVLFGTFDPPHTGHKSLAQAMKQKFGLDTVYFIPRDKADYKPNKQPVSVRNKMIELMVADDPGLKLIPADVAAKMKDIRSNEAFHVLRESFPDEQVSLILGDDTLASLHVNNVKIPEGFQLLVSRREGNEHLDLPKTLDGKPVFMMKVTEESSSTEVRKILSEGGQPEMLPLNVFHYIREHRLYNFPAPLPVTNGSCAEMTRAFWP